jgi:hypothetical protein
MEEAQEYEGKAFNRQSQKEKGLTEMMG